MASNQKVTVETAKELGLLPEEFDSIHEILGREPNYTELNIYSVMWSEHASYKNSIKWIKTLPREGEQLLVKAGEENAGMVDVGDGIACVFKIESHNHPSAVEPFQGAATGVGGINRDIFTMGARPIAQLNSLRLGDLDNPHTQWLIRGITKGIAHYGNAFGVPSVGGEVFFDPCYENNPLVNAMSIGIMDKEDLIRATAGGKGNPVYIVGSATGKDGIHGTSFASADITKDSIDDIPPIQVGDPFQEKLLLEASLELGKSGAIIGMQDMGAAGIICSTSEMSDNGNCGMDIHLDRVPLRQPNMEPWEILLSESQERMLVVAKKGREKEVEAIFDKWDLLCEHIGEVVDGDRLNFYWDGELVADVPAPSLVLGGGAPQYDREYTEPAYFAETKKFDIDSIEEPSLEEAKEIAKFIISHPNIASKKWVYEQYDSMIGTRSMSTNKPSDAAFINLKGTSNAIVCTVDCNGRYVYADPYIGAQIAVAESARNIVSSGGTPLAISNCLNFGNPYNPETYWQFVQAIKGMGDACRKFNTPVTGGNVSFYNQSTLDGKTEAVFPTPTIGMIGLAEKHLQTTLDFKEEGQTIYLLGDIVDDINSSEYLYSYRGVQLSPPPHFDMEREYNLHHTLNGLIIEGLIDSAHDVSDGGLFAALIESAIPNGLGFDILTDSEVRLDSFLFGESQGRVVVTIDPDKEEEFMDMIAMTGFTCCTLGRVTEGEILIDDEDFGDIEDYKTLYNNTFSDRLE